MPSKQGDVTILNDPIAQELLRSTIPARLAYVWPDGTPRVIPIWFHWSGGEIVMGTPLTSPKMKAIQDGAEVALTIDTESWPHRVLLLRGTARVETVDGVVPEYALAAERYFGAEQGKAWVAQVGSLFSQMARITVRPEWVGLLDFEQRFPSAIEAAMAG